MQSTLLRWVRLPCVLWRKQPDNCFRQSARFWPLERPSRYRMQLSLQKHTDRISRSCVFYDHHACSQPLLACSSSRKPRALEFHQGSLNCAELACCVQKHCMLLILCRGCFQGRMELLRAYYQEPNLCLRMWGSGHAVSLRAPAIELVYSRKSRQPLQSNPTKAAWDCPNIWQTEAP